jgi:MurNAc alpha-1-phosphate uridylyltransferase
LNAGRVANDGPSKLTFSGIGVYHPSLFSHIPAGTRSQLAAVLKPQIAENHVSGEHFRGRWSDIGTPERLQALDRALRA